MIPRKLISVDMTRTLGSTIFSFMTLRDSPVIVRIRRIETGVLHILATKLVYSCQASYDTILRDGPAPFDPRFPKTNLAF